MRTRIGLLLVAVVMGGVVIAGRAAGPPRIGTKAPVFALPDLNGKVRSLAEEIKSHRVTLVNFWATWCPPCRGEIPALVAFYKDFAPQGVQILAVDLKEGMQEVSKFASGQGMTFPVLIDRTGAVADMYGISGIPTTYILDANGVIRDVIVGGTTKSVLSSKVRRILPK
ncbi:MAG: TlpA family protein disulfide reductase [Bacteroidota bacterium]